MEPMMHFCHASTMMHNGQGVCKGVIIKVRLVALKVTSAFCCWEDGMDIFCHFALTKLFCDLVLTRRSLSGQRH